MAGTLFENNLSPYITLVESSAPGSPSAGDRRLYVGTDHVLRWKDSGGLASPLAALNKWDGTVAPTVNEDSGDGYAIGSRWIDATAKKEYICLDATVGAAVWHQTDAAGLTNPMANKGEMIVGDTGGTPAALATGTAGLVLTAAGAGNFPAYGEAAWPWLIDIIPMIADPHAVTGTWGLTEAANESIAYPFLKSAVSTVYVELFVNTSVAQNDAISYKLPLAAGTWTMTASVRKATNTGIITLNQDGVSQGTVDTYAASAAYAKVQIAGWTVATSGAKVMQLKMATKNGSSSGYLLEFFGVSFRRTA